ncbi:unnamed protein product [Closterium sp. NIES-65]|nr:unnamed protein product [Closterium sp. NIES-65]
MNDASAWEKRQAKGKEAVERMVAEMMDVYVKPNQANSLRHAGPPGRSPPLSKMNDASAWEKRQAKGKEAVERMVGEMMDVYVKRLRQRRPVYPKFDTEMQRFGESFAYKPTPDQEQAFLDVERDMCERETPMDRLVCGDVGFGKTEVAVRAIFRAVLDKRQAMVLAPTTVLAKQHYKVISARLKDYGVRVALLSRFQKESEKKEVLAGIRDGTLDVVAGTHSLLGAQVVYHNLGLLVIDEEQRFGVRQKERISSLKTSVDVLTLSATPIPRTLYMSMHGFRDASRITTPPPERQPIDTHLLEFDLENVKRAIGDELERGGQVFYVVPRVEGIEEIQMLLEELFPSTRVDVAHGKLRPTDLEAVMERFGEGEIDVLVCTSIIESGIDIRTVNTIVIEDTHLFGLAQIYQLRGRVGRSSSSAHAYLFHPPLHCLTPEAQERLRALQQHSGLGEGYLLAQRDMDIRGIGDVFGERQSGDVGGVGYYLFMEMLHETLTRVEQKSLPRVQFKEVRLDLPLAPLPPIPASYVSDAAVRGSLPREAEEAAAEGMPALLAFCREMRAEYGDEPAQVELLFKNLFVRRMAADLGIYRILQREQGTTIVMETAMKLPAFEILRDAVQQKVMREGLSFRSGRVEVQQQMQAVGQRGPSSTMVATTRKLLQEGGVRALYRGVEPAVVRALSYGCLRLGLYEPCRNMIAPKDKSQVHMGHKALAGIMSGSFATAVSNPLDVAKVRLQMISETAAGSSAASAAVKSAGARSSRSTSGQILEIARTEGVGALWKGVGPSMGRAAALTAAQCAVYDECKQMLKARANVSDGLPLHLSASMLAGAVSTLASSPFDTVKTRMMAIKKSSAAASAASSASSAAPRAPLPPSAASPSIPPQSNATISGASSAFSPVNLQNPAPHNSSAQLQPALAYSTSSASPAPSARPPPLPAARGLPPLGPVPAAAPVAGAAPPATGGAVVYRGSMHCAYSILRTEGIRGLYKGCAANYARLGPMTAITFIVYEQLRSLAGLSSL